MKIALDAMGGDHAPECTVRGALGAAQVIPGTIVLVGQREAMAPYLPHDLPKNIEIFEAPEVVGMEESPTEAMRKKKKSSIAEGLRLVKEGECQAFVSAGNTGAVTATAQLALRRMEGVRRPAILSPFPGKKGRFALLDAGASPDVEPADLVEFALMGKSYAERVWKRRNATVHLVNIGEEPGKGNAFTKEAYKALEGHSWFAGNIEGKDLFREDVDVVVCDAFVGNVVLKTAEGVAEYILSEIKQAVPSGPGKLLFLPLRKALQPLRKKMDYAEYGGSPLVGLNGNVVICHGRSSDRAIANAIAIASRAIESDLIATIKESLVKEAAAVE